MTIEKLLKKIGTAVLLGGSLAATAGITYIPHLDRDTYRVTVTYKQKITDSSPESGENSSKYLVFTKLENGSERVFQNSDSYWESKKNSYDLQNSLEEGQKFEVEVYGWRFPNLSIYENIVDARPIKE